MHATKPIEWNDPTDRTHGIFDRVPFPAGGKFHLSDRPGLGMDFDEAAMSECRVEVAD